jgi:similar to stage IV sporulation protein
MLFNAIWNCLTGYVMIQVEGVSLERFLNIAVSNKIRAWDVRREKYTQLTACISLSGYKKLLKLDEGRHTLHIVKRRGLPYVFSTAKRRWVLSTGLLLTMGAIFVLTSFVWQIQLTGIETIDSYQLMQEIKSYGVTEGTLKSKVDLKALEETLLRNHSEIAWVNAEYKGVLLNVQIVEAKLPQQFIDNEGTADIIAQKDALIKRITVLEGKAAKKEGQTVKKGQMLIEGEVWDEGKPRMSFHARGSVIGSIWYQGEASAKAYDTIRKPSGKTSELRYLKIGNNLVLMGGTNAGFKKYDSVESVKYALGENLFFPVKILDVMQYEINEQHLLRPIVEASTEAEEKAYFEAMKKVPKDAAVTGMTTKFVIKEDFIYAICYIETEEEIGITVNTKDKTLGGQ